MLYMLLIFTAVVVCYIGVTGAGSASGHDRDWDERRRTEQRGDRQAEPPDRQ